jgi:diguanylate cyclase (GGDEF)-like protein/PAS domain S-box-containing protein
VIILLINIIKRKKVEQRLLRQNEELTAIYEELTASEEELRQQFEEIVIQQEVIKQSKERYKLALEATKDTIWEWDLAQDQRFYSGKTLEMLGYKGEELCSYEDWKKLIHPDDIEVVEENLRAHFEEKREIYVSEYRIRCHDGHYKWISAKGKTLFNSSGKAYKMVGSHSDITELKEQQERIKHLAYHDFLTGLPNRASFKDITEQEIYIAKTKDISFALFFIDVDNFKVVNDSLGHGIGDKLLVKISQALASYEYPEKFVAKLGGDEFVILLRNLKDKETALRHAEQIMGLFQQPFRLKTHNCHVSISVGIVFYPQDGKNFEELLINADIAMYKAKELGKKRFVFFDQKMKDEFEEKERMQNSLCQAIAEKEFILHYQPQVDLESDRIIGFEALIRWQNPEKGIIQPNRFISLAEESGLIVPIGDWVLREACTFAKKLQDLGYPGKTIAVNISTVQLRQNDFVDKVLAVLEETGLAPVNLELEITETVLIEFFDHHIHAKLNLLQKKGIRIALDDFGRGYSSLNYIKQLSISTLKIDKSFIGDIDDRDDSTNITGAIIILAHQLGLKVVAEGVELPEQIEYLRNYHCDVIQGYIVSRPLPEEKILEMLADTF